MKKFITKTIAIILLATSLVSYFTKSPAIFTFPEKISCFTVSDDDNLDPGISIFEK